MGIVVSSNKGWEKTERYLRRAKRKDMYDILDRFGALGVDALSLATPVDSSLTAHSWTYEIVIRAGYYSIRWHNTHVVDGRPIAILLQYGHGTRNGGYVQGRDYIMPAIRPIFDKIDAEVRRVVTN